ncbi:hypothetical protein EYF80_048026 [Liparis tanakae]|uniref:Uncharacterized protein n=1 Tax=Liparis tanakae TaxID=230148 RepID=A0A4Z2FLL8_9TELE|nr:hypothetical protein EYF80_048026 [Liparis tanakae]
MQTCLPVSAVCTCSDLPSEFEGRLEDVVDVGRPLQLVETRDYFGRSISPNDETRNAFLGTFSVLLLSCGGQGRRMINVSFAKAL